jgi:radical SAM protein with 4Fe4S-binding SPASM domain
LSKIQTIEIREKNRVDLSKEVPLVFPLSMFVDTGNLCNLQCSFCPTGDRVLRQGRPNGMMQLSTMNKIVSDLKDWGIQLNKLHLYKDGEPLLNKNIFTFIRDLKDAEVSKEIWLKTNGVLLSPEMNIKLVESGLDFCGVSINGTSNDSYLNITRTKVNYERLKEGVKDLYNRRGNMRVFVKTVDSGLTEEEKEQFYSDFCGISDNCSIEQLHGWSASNENKDWKLGTTPTTFEGYPLVEKIVCPLPFFMLAVNWNGHVSPCNEDFMQYAVLGDINKQSLQEIWEGEELKKFRIMHLESRRGENKSCNGCDYLKTLPDRIDDSRLEILKRLK